jgi:RimJ/RimL family protein N-acetyltransferase
MLEATIVTTEDELAQIHQLNQLNLKQNLSEKEKKEEGFVSWLYSMKLLEQMHKLAPSIIVKDEDKVVGYALVTLKEAREFHPDLRTMITNLQPLHYNGKLLFTYSFYCMGQICIDKNYRGKGVFNNLYQHHKKIYQTKFDLLITEISTHNPRSQKAHEKVGFKTIHNYKDVMDEWNVVGWDWQ